MAETKVYGTNKEKVEYINRLYDESTKYYSSWRDELTKAYKQYKSVLDIDSSKDYYKWRSRLFIPATARAVDGLLPDLMLTLFGPDPFFETVPREPSDVIQSKILEPLLLYQFDSTDFFTNFFDFLKQMAIYGTTFGKVYITSKKRKVKKSVPQEFMGIEIGEPKEEYEEIEIYDGPVFETIDIYDLRFSPNAKSIDDTWVIHRTEKTIGDMKKLGIYKNLDKLEYSIAQDKLSSKYDEEVRKSLNGFPSAYTQEEGDDRRVELLEYWDRSRSKTCTIAGRSTIVRPERDNPLGIDPFVSCKLWGMPFELLGTGIPKKVEDLQNQLNCEVNQRLDNRNIRQNVTLKVRRGANVNVRNLLTKPGGIWLTDEMDAIDPIVIPDISSSTSFAEENLLESKCEEITGVTRYATGQGSGSSKTATEASILTRMASKAFALHLRIIEEMALRPILRKFAALNSNPDFMDKERVEKVVGPLGAMWEPSSETAINFRLLASSQLTDKNLKVQQMIQLLGMLKDDPTINKMEIVKRIYEAWGYKDFATLQQQMPPQMPQQGMPQNMGTPPGLGAGIPPTGVRPGSPAEGGLPMMAGMGGARP